jgi:hypothetical protein
MISCDDIIRTNENVKDYMRTLGMCLYKVLCYSGELDNENPSLITSTTVAMSRSHKLITLASNTTHKIV